MWRAVSFWTCFELNELFHSAATLFYKHPTEPSTVTLSVKVTNTGTVAGSDIVFIFSFDEIRYVTPDYERLHFFSKVDMELQESQTISYVLDVEELKYIGHEEKKHKVNPNGMWFKLGIGHHADCRLDEGICTYDIAVEAGPMNSKVCDAACSVWANSPCLLREKKCLDMCADQGGRGSESRLSHQHGTYFRIFSLILNSLFEYFATGDGTIFTASNQ